MNKKLLWLLTLLILAAGTFAKAQQPVKVYRIGLLTWEAPSPSSSPTPFEQGLRQLGYVEGQNIAIEHRYADRWTAFRNWRWTWRASRWT